MRLIIVFAGALFVCLQVTASEAARPCLPEAKAYVDEASDATATSSALSYCLAVTPLDGAPAGGTGTGIVVLQPRPGVRDTWIILPPDMLQVLQDNGYGQFLTNGGVWLGTQSGGSLPNLVLPQDVQLPQGFVPPEGLNLTQPDSVLQDAIAPDAAVPDGGFEGGVDGGMQ